MADWKDLALRENLTMTEGVTPITGTLCSSPDIIVTQTVPSDPTGAYIDGPNWTQDFGNRVVGTQPNYFYIRAHNFAPGAATGKVYLYRAKNTLINTWTEWMTEEYQLLPQTQTGDKFVTLSATEGDQKILADNPFYWGNASNPDPPANHWCLLALLDTAANPNPLIHGTYPPNITSTADICNNYLNVSWRNLQPVDFSAAPTLTDSVNMSVPDGFGPRDKLQVSIIVPPTWAGPPGTGAAVAFSCSDTEHFTPPLQLQPTPILTPGEVGSAYSFPSDPPPKNVWINVSVWYNKVQPVLGDQVQLAAAWVTSQSSDSLAYLESGVASVIQDGDPDVDPMLAIPIGQTTWVHSTP